MRGPVLVATSVPIKFEMSNVIHTNDMMTLSLTETRFLCPTRYKNRSVRSRSSQAVSCLGAEDEMRSRVMPYAVLYELRGQWTFGWAFCYFWISCDVMCCTASILHLCVISVDRYLAVTEPLHAVTEPWPGRHRAADVPRSDDAASRAGGRRRRLDVQLGHLVRARLRRLVRPGGRRQRTASHAALRGRTGVWTVRQPRLRRPISTRLTREQHRVANFEVCDCIVPPYYANVAVHCVTTVWCSENPILNIPLFCHKCLISSRRAWLVMLNQFRVYGVLGTRVTMHWLLGIFGECQLLQPYARRRFSLRRILTAGRRSRRMKQLKCS